MKQLLDGRFFELNESSANPGHLTLSEQTLLCQKNVAATGDHQPDLAAVRRIDVPPCVLIHPAARESFNVDTPGVNWLVCLIDPEILNEIPLYLEASRRLQLSN
jgi:hypothetical protein